MNGKLNLETIIRELKKDNEEPIEMLYDYYYPRLFNFSKSFLKFEDGIDDIIQEVFVKIWQNRGVIDNSSTFNAFIFTITRNLLLNELRSRLNSQNVKDEVRNLSLAPEYRLSNPVEYDELKKKVDEVIDELPERQREIFILSRNEGLSHKEISQKLGITTKTVEYHITLSISCIKSKLKEFGLISMLYFYIFL